MCSDSLVLRTVQASVLVLDADAPSGEKALGCCVQCRVGSQFMCLGGLGFPSYQRHFSVNLGSECPHGLFNRSHLFSFTLLPLNSRCCEGVEEE